MNVVISFEEIDARFAGTWVLVTDIESDPGPVFRRGRVVWTSPDQDECWQYAIDHHVGDCGVFYAGPWSADDEPVPML